MLNRITCIAAVLFALSACGLAAQQGGVLSLVLLESLGDTVRFAEASVHDTVPRLVSADGRYTISPTVMTRHLFRREGVAMKSDGREPYVMIRPFGGKQFTITVTRATSAEAGAPADTMVLSLLEVPGLPFGAAVRYRSGGWQAVVADTTLYPVYDEKGNIVRYRMKTIPELYPSYIFGGYDISWAIEAAERY